MHVLFPGSFDPPHLGHFDLVTRAAAMFERVTVALALNPEKRPFLPVERRLALLAAMCAGIANVEITSYQGQTAAFAKSRGCQALLRGARDGADLGYELAMSAINRDAGGIDTLLLPAAPAVSHIASTLVRAAIGAGMPIAGLVHPAVAAGLRERAQG